MYQHTQIGTFQGVVNYIVSFLFNVTAVTPGTPSVGKYKFHYLSRSIPWVYLQLYPFNFFITARQHKHLVSSFWF